MSEQRSKGCWLGPIIKYSHSTMWHCHVVLLTYIKYRYHTMWATRCLDLNYLTKVNDNSPTK